MGLFGKLFGGGKGSKTGTNSSVLDIAPLLAKANSLIDENKFAEAAQVLATVKDTHPERVSARVNYAYCLLNLGRGFQAKDELQACIEIDPKNVDALYMLSGLLAEQEEWTEVETTLQALLEVQPGFVAAYADLTRALFSLERYEEALKVCQSGLNVQPDDASILQAKGNVHLALDEFDEALNCFEQVLVKQPNDLDALHSTVLVYERTERQNEALVLAEKIHQAMPENQTFLITKARSLVSVGRVQDGCLLLEDALERSPGNKEMLSNLATYLEIAGKHDKAIACLRQILQMEPNNEEALLQIAQSYNSKRDYKAALEFLNRLLVLTPESALAWNMRGCSLLLSGQIDEGEKSVKKSLEIKPDHHESLLNLGGAHRDNGRLDEAIKYFDRVLEIRPKDVTAHDNRLYCMSYSEQFSPRQYIDEARRRDGILNSERTPFAEWATGGPGSALNGKLRIGFVSGDLRRHPVGYFLETTIKHLDLEKFELYAYPTSSLEDELSKRIRPFFHQWRPIVGMTDVLASKAIHDDGVHILVDLSGFSAANRLSIFPYRAAPVQATWLGFFASTGMKSIDYMLVDPHGVYPGEEWMYSEKLCFLPETRLCFTPPSDKPVSPLPALEKGQVTLACHQDTTKINARVLSCWDAIMKALPNSRLRLRSRQTVDPAFRQRLRERLGDAGLDVERIEIPSAVPYEAYLNSYSSVDFMLDTFPYTGGTTTCEALWMGVPTVTLSGNTLLARQGAGLMKCAGLADWVAESEEEYVRLAIEKAGNIPALAQTRATIRDQAAATSLFDGKRFASQLSEAFEAMWRGEV